MTDKSIFRRNVAAVNAGIRSELESTLSEESQLLAKLIYENNLCVILNVGSGDGTSLMDVRIYNMNKLYVGVEEDDELLRLARKKAEGRKGVIFDKGKLLDLQYAEGTFDLVYATNNLIGNIPEKKRKDFITQSFNVLRRNGYLVVSSWNKDENTTRFLNDYYTMIGSTFVNISPDHIATNNGFYNRVSTVSIMKDYLPNRTERRYVIESEGEQHLGLYDAIVFKKI